MRTKSRACKRNTALGVLYDATLPTEVSDNAVDVGTISCHGSVPVSSCYGEGFNVCTEMGSSLLKRKVSFVENSSVVVVSGEVCYVGSCDIRDSKKLAVDENIDEATVGGSDANDKRDMCLGEQTRCHREIVAGFSAGDVSHKDSCTLESSPDVVNVLKRKRSCVEEPLLQGDMTRRMEDVEVSAGVSDAVLEYACSSINVLKRKGVDLEKPHLNSSNVSLRKVLDFHTGRCLSYLWVDTEPAMTKKKRIIVDEQVWGQGVTNRLSRVSESVGNVQSTAFMHNVSESLSHNVAHTALFPRPVILDFESGTVHPAAATNVYDELAEATIREPITLDFRLGMSYNASRAPFPPLVTLGFHSGTVRTAAANDVYDQLTEADANSCGDGRYTATVRDPVTLDFRSGKTYNACQGDTFATRESPSVEHTVQPSVGGDTFDGYEFPSTQYISRSSAQGCKDRVFWPLFQPLI